MSKVYRFLELDNNIIFESLSTIFNKNIFPFKTRNNVGVEFEQFSFQPKKRNESLSEPRKTKRGKIVKDFSPL